MIKWIRMTDAKWYGYEVFGAQYPTWVSADHKAHAGTFDTRDVREWLTVLGRMDKRLDLEAVAPSD